MWDVDQETFAAAQQAGATIVDVREPMEYVQGHVPGAVLMPMSQLGSRLGELDKTAPLYLICATGNRSGAMTDALRSRGYQAWNVAGGTMAWARAGRPLESGLPTTTA